MRCVSGVTVASRAEFRRAAEFVPALNFHRKSLVAATLIVLGVFAWPPTASTQDASDTDSRHAEAVGYVNALEAAWNQRVEQSPRVKKAAEGQDRWNETQLELAELIMERCKEKSAENKLIDVLSEGGLPKFADKAADMLARVLTVKRQRDQIVKLLSHRCPPSIPGDELEGVLVIQRSIPDGLLILCDAVDASTDPHVRLELGKALRNGLSPLGVDDPDPKIMASKARDWYLANKDKYEPNPGYEVTPDMRKGLFIRKTK